MKSNKALTGLILLLLAIVVALLFVRGASEPEYTAVFLRTGDLYFGELTHFPTFGLRHVYLIQSNPQNQQAPLSVQKFSNIFWGPQDYLKINENEVVWTAELNSTGQLAQFLKANPNLMQQNAQPSQSPEAPTPVPGPKTK